MKNLMMLGMSLLVLGCAGAQTASVSLSPSGNSGPTGQIVGTVGIIVEGSEASPNYENRLLFRSMDGDITGEIAFSRSIIVTPDTHYSTDSERGSVFSLELPEGNYEFYDVRFYHTGSFARTTIRSRQEFSAPFTVEANRVSYLGSFVAHGAWRMDDPTIGSPIGGYFTVADQFDRDKPLIAGVHPEIAAGSIERRLLRRTAPPFVVRFVPALDEEQT